MPDMLCSLIRLPDVRPLLNKLKEDGITLRRPNPWEQKELREFILEHFTERWADETSIAFGSKPVSCFVALEGEKIVGFGGYECSRRNYFGPTGVDESYRKKGIGSALLLTCLEGLRDLGYTYAAIGGAGPVGFYKKAVGAIEIPFDEGKGIYGLSEVPKYMSERSE